MPRFGGKRSNRQGRGTDEATPPTPWPAPSQSPTIDPLLPESWPDDEVAADLELEESEMFDDDAEDGWQDWVYESTLGEPVDVGRVLDPAGIDQDEGMVLMRRSRQGRVFDQEEQQDDLGGFDDVPLLPLPNTFRAMPETWAARRNRAAGAAALPDTETVEESPRRMVSRPYRLDPFMFDPSSILVNRLNWYIDDVEVGTGPGFEALVFGVGGYPDVCVQLIVPTSVDGWTFDSAVQDLEEVHVRSLGDSDTAVGFDAAGDTVCVCLRQHLDVYAVRLTGSNQFAVAVEIADRYAQVIDDEL